MDEKSRYLPTRNAAYRKIGDEVVVVDTANNRMMTLNETGSAIWMMLDGRPNVAAFLAEMEARGLIAARPGGEP